MMLNSKVVDYINYILRAAEFKNCDTEKVSRYTRGLENILVALDQGAIAILYDSN